MFWCWRPMCRFLKNHTHIILPITYYFHHGQRPACRPPEVRQETDWKGEHPWTNRRTNEIENKKQKIGKKRMKKKRKDCTTSSTWPVISLQRKERGGEKKEKKKKRSTPWGVFFSNPWLCSWRWWWWRDVKEEKSDKSAPAPMFFPPFRKNK